MIHQPDNGPINSSNGMNQSMSAELKIPTRWGEASHYSRKLNLSNTMAAYLKDTDTKSPSQRTLSIRKVTLQLHVNGFNVTSLLPA